GSRVRKLTPKPQVTSGSTRRCSTPPVQALGYPPLGPRHSDDNVALGQSPPSSTPVPTPATCHVARCWSPRPPAAHIRAHRRNIALMARLLVRAPSNKSSSFSARCRLDLRPIKTKIDCASHRESLPQLSCRCMVVVVGFRGGGRAAGAIQNNSEPQNP